MEVYADDPLLAAWGTDNERATEVAVALVWASVVGFPLSWHKTVVGGATIVWIGAELRLSMGGRSMNGPMPARRLYDIASFCHE